MIRGEKDLSCYFENIPRVYHPWYKWEDYEHGFYDNMSGAKGDEMRARVEELFASKSKTKMYMLKVVGEWKYSCEHNLTNETMNKVAWLGQAACAMYANVPATITMSAWSSLPEKHRDQADKIACEVIAHWATKIWSKQTCLNLD